jgi:MFS family permease
MLCVTVFFLFADQNLLAPNLSAIARDFHFSNHERDQKLGGAIAFGFFIVGGLFALVIGFFTDITNRCMLFGVVVAIGESACLATYWVRTYNQLFLCRVLTGISFGGATPIIFSILGDYYPGNSRIYVSTVVGIASSSGIAAGQFLAGMIGPALGWRTPFMIVAIPAIICAIVTFFTVDEPKRGDQEDAMRSVRQIRNSTAGASLLSPYQNGQYCEKFIDQKCSIDSVDVPLAVPSLSPDQSGLKHGLSTLDERTPHHAIQTTINSSTSLVNVEYSEKIDCQKFRQLFRTPSVVIIFLQGFPGCLPWGMIFVFLNDYLSEDRGTTVEQATAILTCFGIGGLIGQMFGGWAGQRLYNQNPQWQCLLMGFSTLLSVPPALFILNSNQINNPGFYLMAVLFGFIVNINGPNVRAILQVRRKIFLSKYQDLVTQDNS